MKDVSLRTDRFLLRSLRPEDVTPRYSAWLEEEAARAYIDSAAAPHTVDDLRRFVERCLRADDVLLLGIFEGEGGRHIGNIKYEPVDRARGYAIMGILIGEPDWRGKGAATEILRAADDWLFRTFELKEIALAVHTANAGAVRAYEKVGYRAEKVPYFSCPPESGKISMLRRRPD